MKKNKMVLIAAIFVLATTFEAFKLSSLKSDNNDLADGHYINITYS